MNPALKEAVDHFLIHFRKCVHVDTGNALRVDIPCLLKLANWEDTPENRDRMTELAQRAVAQVMPDVQQVVVKDGGGQ